MKWNPKPEIRRIEKYLAGQLDKAAEVVQVTIQKSFGSPPPEPKKSGKGFKRNSSKAWKRKHPSAPWTPPHIQTGTLKRSIGTDRPEILVRRVGVGIGRGETVAKKDGKLRGYAWLLEYGGKKSYEIKPRYKKALAFDGIVVKRVKAHPPMFPRPYLRPGFWKSRDTVKRILSTPMALGGKR